MEELLTVGFSTFQCDGPSSQKSQQGIIREHNYCVSRMEGASVVPVVTSTVEDSASTSATAAIHQEASAGSKAASNVWTDIASRLSETHHIPMKTVNMILASVRESTKQQYAVYLRKFLFNFGDIATCGVQEVLGFLQQLYDDGLGYSAINSARSAISTVLDLLVGNQIGCDPLVKRFMKGVFENRPAMPRYTSTWDPDIVTQYLDVDSGTLTNMELSRKALVLFLLGSGQRISNISELVLADIVFSSAGVTVNIPSVLKQTRPGYHQKPVQFSEFPEKPHVCVVYQLRLYIERTKLARENCPGDGQPLWVTNAKPYKAATKNTLSNWVRFVLS